MTRDFCVVIPELGARSETFIRRHVRDLLPGRTVVIGGELSGGAPRDWDASGPVLQIDRLSAESVERWLRDYGVRVMMAEYLDTAFPWLGMAQRLGIRFFAHAHGYDVSQRLREPHFQQEYLRLAEGTGVITMSEVSRQRLLDLGLMPDKVHVIPYGVIAPDVCDAPQSSPTVNVVAVGRMVPKKAPLSTLAAFRLAAESCPELRLGFYGGGRLLPTVAETVNRTAILRSRVTLFGAQPHDIVLAGLRSGHLFVQHSVTDPETGDEEGLPVAILEAMAAGLPIVATRHAGIPEAVAHGTTGYLVDEGDVRGMAHQIIQLARDPDARRTMGLAGRAVAVERFSWKRERSQLLKVIGLVEDVLA